MREKLRRKFLTLVFLLFFFSFLVCEKILEKCRKKTLWNPREKPSLEVTAKIEKAIKQLENIKMPKRNRAKLQIRRLAPSALRFLKSYPLNRLIAEQREALRPYKYLQLNAIEDIKLICSKGNIFVWFAVFRMLNNYAFYIVGNQEKVIDSFVVSPSWHITFYSCNLMEEKEVDYAIEFSSYPKSAVVTSKGIFRNASLRHSQSRLRFVIILRKDNGKLIKNLVLYGRQKLGPYLGNPDIIFGPDTQGVAIVATKPSEKEVVVVNGKEIGEYLKVMSTSFVFSSNGERYAFFAKKENGEWVVVVDGKELYKYGPFSFEFEVGYNRLSKRAFSGALTKVNKRALRRKVKSAMTVVDYWQYFSTPLFSPDNKHVAFGICKEKGECIVVLDGKESNEYRFIDFYSLKFTQKGKLGYLASKWGQENVIVVGNKEVYKTKNSILTSFAFSRRSKIVFAELKENGKGVVIKDGKESAEYLAIESIWLSPNGKRLAFVAQKDNARKVVVVDGKESQEYANIYLHSFKFSSNSKAWGVVAQKEDGRSVVVFNGKESKPYKEIFFFDISSNAEKSAFLAKNREWIGVVNSKESKPYSEIYNYEIKFTKNGRYAVFVGRNPTIEKDELVINQKVVLTAKKLSQVFVNRNSLNVVGFSPTNKIFLLSCDLK